MTITSSRNFRRSRSLALALRITKRARYTHSYFLSNDTKIAVSVQCLETKFPWTILWGFVGLNITNYHEYLYRRVSLRFNKFISTLDKLIFVVNIFVWTNRYSDCRWYCTNRDFNTCALIHVCRNFLYFNYLIIGPQWRIA